MRKIDKERLLEKTIDEYPRWIIDGGAIICSVCGNPVNYPQGRCPYCESDMTGGKGDKDDDKRVY